MEDFTICSYIFPRNLPYFLEDFPLTATFAPPASWRDQRLRVQLALIIETLFGGQQAAGTIQVAKKSEISWEKGWMNGDWMEKIHGIIILFHSIPENIFHDIPVYIWQKIFHWYSMKYIHYYPL